MLVGNRHRRCNIQIAVGAQLLASMRLLEEVLLPLVGKDLIAV
jgi:hypothetical protein